MGSRHRTFVCPLFPAGSVAAAREVDAQERPIGTAIVDKGSLVHIVFGISPPRTFALRLNAPASQARQRYSQSPVALQYDLAVATNDDTKTNGGGFDGKGNALHRGNTARYSQPITMCGSNFARSKTNTSECHCGQEDRRSNCPQDRYNRVYVLAASADNDQMADFLIGEPRKITVEYSGLERVHRAVGYAFVEEPIRT